MAADLIAQELAEINAAGELADKYKWAEDNKDYMSMKNAIRKKYKGLMKMSMMTIKTEMGSSSAKQTKKEKIMWVHSAMKDAGDFTEAVGLLPEVFGPGKYGTSGVNSRGGKQNFKGELCAWKRVAKDGKHYRILEHTTGYFFQEGFLASQMTESGEEEGEKDEEEGEEEGGDNDDDDKEEEEEEAPPPKKQKGGKGAAVPAEAPKARAKAPKAAKEAPKASPQRASKRGRK